MNLEQRKAAQIQSIDGLTSQFDDEQLRDLTNFEQLVETELGQLKM